MSTLFKYLLLIVSSIPAFILSADDFTISENGSIRWDDTLLENKPDGNWMYLVSKKNVLIESTKFSVQTPLGQSRSNLLPWRIRQYKDEKGLTYKEPIKIGDAKGFLKIEHKPLENRKIDCSIDFKAEGYNTNLQTLNLPIHVFAGKKFYVNGVPYTYSEGTGKSRHHINLLKRTRLEEFIASDEKYGAFKIIPKSELEIEIVEKLDWKGHRSIWLNLYPVNGERIEYRFVLPPELNEDTQLSYKANAIENGSFENGREGWGIIFKKRDVTSDWSLTKEASSEGSTSLKVSVIEQKHVFEPLVKSAIVASDYFQSTALKSVRFSVDLKADKIGQKAKLQIRYVPTALVPNDGSNLLEKEVVLSKKWERYGFNVDLPLAENNAYAVAIEFPEIKAGDSVFVDALRIGSPEDINYSAYSELESGLDTIRYRRIYELNEPFDLISYLKNNGKKRVNYKLLLKIRDTEGQLVYEAEKPYKALRKGGHYEHQWETPSFKKQGMYRAELLTLNKDSDVINRNHISLAVLRKRELNVVDPSNKFGVNITDLREFWALERIGIGWSRFTFNCSLSDLMPSKGVWNHQHEKRLSALLDYQKEFGVTPLAVLGPGIPKWASSGPPGSSSSRVYAPKTSLNHYFDDYLTRLLDFTDGRLYAIETWNEPDIPLFYRGSVQEMADFSKLCYGIIKREKPDIEVVGLGLATPAETKNTFLDKLLNQVSLDNFDAISYHPYTEGRRHPARGHFRDVVQGFYSKVESFGPVPPLWATEFGWFGLAHDAKKFVPYKNPFVAREILDEKESAEAYIQSICTAFANGVEKTFYFTLLEGNILDRWLHGWVGPGGRSVELGFIAAATACDLIADMQCLGQEFIEGGICQTKFSNSSKNIVVLWSESKVKTLNLPLTENLTVYDLYGNSMPLNFNNGGTFVEIKVSSQPIYLVYEK